VDRKIKRTKKVVVKKENFFSNFDKEKNNGVKWKHFEVGI
jgi:hypothetical protein